MNDPTSTFAKTTSSVPFNERFWEDYWIGEVLECGDYLITEAEIIEFASKYDPQAFHLDHDAANKSSFGQLVGSGWMTVGIMMRLMVLHFISPLSSMGSPGVDQVRWHLPTKVGDRLRLRITTTDRKQSQSKPDRGMLWFNSEIFNQDNQLLMTLKGMGMNRCRPPGSE